ncbi:calcium-dependent protein kinase 26 isoform X1 [Octopus sinensis]|uniref:Calcium-dependent protein kinase 26 isoform X1 n=1 Tax=Octopus sinensis TaxID=2607531 RepID=A0A7E6EQ79_9MOLL|nr:calcium-dependent protein kinase 26 isoform X1 [Octopus sinensis]
MSANRDRNNPKFWEKHFESIDKKGGNYLSLDELCDSLYDKGINVSRQTFKSVLQDMDVDSDGKISKCEFVEAMSKPSLNDPKALRRAFEEMDKDKSGFLTKCEVEQVLKQNGMKYTDEDLKVMFDAVSGRDGKIDYDEFEKAMRR